MAQTIINIKNATVTFAADQASLATSPGYECQVTSAVVSANAKLQTVPQTYCDPESQAAAASSFQLDLGWLQDWGADPNSLSQYLFDHDATLSWFRIEPTDVGSTLAMPGCQGQCWLVPGDYSSPPGIPAVATATLPIVGKPEIAATLTP